MQNISLKDRKAILSEEISKYIKKGYRVVSQTDTTAQLVKPKKFGFLIAIICLILAILPFILYLLYFMSKKDETVYIEVNELGEVKLVG